MAEVYIRGLGTLNRIPAGPDAGPGDIPLPRGLKPRKARRLCTQSRLALYAADRAWGEAGFDGEPGAVLVAMTHGSTSFLQEFHDYLLDHGPQAASPNAFAGGVAGAPLAAISTHLGLTLGGTTLVGHEASGLELLNMAARLVASGAAWRAPARSTRSWCRKCMQRTAGIRASRRRTCPTRVTMAPARRCPWQRGAPSSPSGERGSTQAYVTARWTTRAASPSRWTW